MVAYTPPRQGAAAEMIPLSAGFYARYYYYFVATNKKPLSHWVDM